MVDEDVLSHSVLLSGLRWLKPISFSSFCWVSSKQCIVMKVWAREKTNTQTQCCEFLFATHPAQIKALLHWPNAFLSELRAWSSCFVLNMYTKGCPTSAAQWDKLGFCCFLYLLHCTVPFEILTFPLQWLLSEIARQEFNMKSGWLQSLIF